MARSRTLIKVLVTALFLSFSFTLVSMNQNASAVSISCDSSSDLQNSAIYWACKECSSETPNCGALWLNSSASASTSTTVYGDATASTVTAYIRGAIYNHNGSTDVGTWRTAYHVYVLREACNIGAWSDAQSSCITGGKNGKGLRVNFISGIKQGQVNRGYVNAKSWSTGWDTDSARDEVTINVKKFIKGVVDDDDNDETGAVYIGTDDDGNYVYERVVHMFRCYSEGSGCGTSESKIRLKVKPTCNTYTYNSSYSGAVRYNRTSGELYSGGSLYSNNPVSDGTYYTKKESQSHNFSGYISTTNPNTKKNGSESVTEPKPKGSSGYLHGWSRTKWSSASGSSGTYIYDNIALAFKPQGDEQEKYHTTQRNAEDLARQPLYTAGSNSDTVAYGTEKTFTDTMSYGSSSTVTRKICKIQGDVVSDTSDKNSALPAEDDGSGSASATVTIKNPFNFYTSISASVNGDAGAIVFAGQDANISYNAEIYPRVNRIVDGTTYVTKVPDSTKIQGVAFVLNNKATQQQAGALNAFLGKEDIGTIEGDDLCTYINQLFGTYMASGTSCATMAVRYGSSDNGTNGKDSLSSINSFISNPGSAVGGSGHISIATESNRMVPDVEQGSKYCVAAGIRNSDSHGSIGSHGDVKSDVDQSISMSTSGSGRWILSKIQCKTIAKVPSFQTWGNLYTSGGIKSVTIKKVPGATLTDTPGSKPAYLFGSWDEGLTIANTQVRGFSSGAAIGYNTGDTAGGQKYTGGADASYCDVTKLTIANNKCKSEGSSGNAGSVVAYILDTLEKIKARYTPTGNKSDNTVYRVADDTYLVIAPNKTKLSQIFNAQADATSGGLPGSSFFYGTSATAPGPIAFNSGTLVVFVKGDLVIDHGICTGYSDGGWSCNAAEAEDYVAQNGKGNQSYTMSNINAVYSSGTKLPQVILIADGNVEVEENVTQIDAWIFSSKNLDTCVATSTSGAIEDHCNKVLFVNGPVFAESISLNRIGGATPGNRGTAQINNNTNLAETGSTTPAELFSMRPDVYQWIYQQTSTKANSANVRYIRELSPRY